jgi:hypothetical protein
MDCRWIVLLGVKYAYCRTRKSCLQFCTKIANIAAKRIISTYEMEVSYKWWYPQIIHFNRIIPYKHILGYPIYGNPPNDPLLWSEYPHFGIHKLPLIFQWFTSWTRWFFITMSGVNKSEFWDVIGLNSPIFLVFNFAMAHDTVI